MRAGIVEVVKYPITRICCPLVVGALSAAPADLRLGADATKGWAVTIVESGLVLLTVIFAWYLQMIVSAFYSGLRGGRMFADAAIALMHDYDLMKSARLLRPPPRAHSRTAAQPHATPRGRPRRLTSRARARPQVRAAHRAAVQPRRVVL